MLRAGSQSLPKTKLKPERAERVARFRIRRMKKKTISARIAAASVVSPHLRTRSGSRLAADRSRGERPAETDGGACLHAPTRSATRCRSSSPAASVLRDQAGWQRRVGQLAWTGAQCLLTRAERVGPGTSSAAGHGRAGLAVLAGVLVDVQERLRDDRVRTCARRVDRRDPQVGRDPDARWRRPTCSGSSAATN